MQHDMPNQTVPTVTLFYKPKLSIRKKKHAQRVASDWHSKSASLDNFIHLF